MVLTEILGMTPEQALAMNRLNIPYASVSRIEIFHDNDGLLWPKLMFMNRQEMTS
jgi:hypothetical protein